MANGTWSSLTDAYDGINRKIYDNSDIRTRDMLFMRNLGGVVLLTAAYLLVATLGPRVMAHRKAFELKWPMFAYNVVMSVGSLWMCWEMLINSWRSGYTLICDPYKVSYEPSELRVINANWWYFVTKAIEFLDTVFMVLKKKNSQITVLHVWHHTFMFPFLFTCVLVGPYGQVLLGPIINSFIHVIMYGYYALSLFTALHPYLWWKKYLTQMQLIQFVIIMVSNCYAMAVGCYYSPVVMYGQSAFLLSLVVLFGNFYIQSYIVKRKQRSSHRSTPVANGGHKKDS
ncbi:putative Elongation of very long chain fatty acids protein 2 [Hypsibius exemplaris]|uniref:Elongation of very long chain fatty acids protein n=1 Tax=Hypsibius exemplaris TaxID=2072580 RepID=A0A1W0WUE9_HYPEX|nr:putative Elongation of very long chain fatty acids protein 2 [Hypsibius exemplaris]